MGLSPILRSPNLPFLGSKPFFIIRGDSPQTPSGFSWGLRWPVFSLAVAPKGPREILLGGWGVLPSLLKREPLFFWAPLGPGGVSLLFFGASNFLEGPQGFFGGFPPFLGGNPPHILLGGSSLLEYFCISPTLLGGQGPLHKVGLP